ncbi:MAG: hypothetical protein AAFX06_32595 [Planctomycetota bacterium]
MIDMPNDEFEDALRAFAHEQAEQLGPPLHRTLVWFLERMLEASYEQPKHLYYRATLHTKYNQDGDHWTESDPALAMEWLREYDESAEELTALLAESTEGFSESALRLVETIRLRVTRRLPSERSAGSVTVDGSGIEDYFIKSIHRISEIEPQIVEVLAAVKAAIARIQNPEGVAENKRQYKTPKQKGVSALDAALFIENFKEDDARAIADDWRLRRVFKSLKSIGKDCRKGHRKHNLFDLRELAEKVSELQQYDSDDKSRLFMFLTLCQREPF